MVGEHSQGSRGSGRGRPAGGAAREQRQKQQMGPSTVSAAVCPPPSVTSDQHVCPSGVLTVWKRTSGLRGAQRPPRIAGMRLPLGQSHGLLATRSLWCHLPPEDVRGATHHVDGHGYPRPRQASRQQDLSLPVSEPVLTRASGRSSSSPEGPVPALLPSALIQRTNIAGGPTR